VRVRCYRGVKEIPQCKLAVEAKIPTTDVTALTSDLPNVDNVDERTQRAENVEEQTSEQPAADSQVAEQSETPEQPTAAAVPQKNLAETPSHAYLRAIIPNLDSIIAENDFSSLNAEKR